MVMMVVMVKIEIILTMIMIMVSMIKITINYNFLKPDWLIRHSLNLTAKSFIRVFNNKILLLDTCYRTAENIIHSLSSWLSDQS